MTISLYHPSWKKSTDIPDDCKWEIVVNNSVLEADNPNPLKNTQVYNVILPDGTVQQYSENTIADDLFGQVDDDGNYESRWVIGLEK